ncbi:catalase-like [Anticarsia gemmatalis]|uniref:catalase-like n=1 Tax=Anticarsia gemmatalis TaxID=129554 RepID=UPI003F759117
MILKLIRFFIYIILTAVMAEAKNDPVRDQIALFKNSTMGPIGIMTTAAGAPIDNDDTVTLNKRLLYNEYFLDSLTHLVRERMPERIVHAKAGGAFGYFEVTHDITNICKAKLFSKVGKRTPIAARFSPVIVSKGGVDTARDARGFAIKFYTEDGNFDIAGFNTPMYVYKDPIHFATFVRVIKGNPATNIFDPTMFWDFVTLRPESLHMFLLVFGDRGIPDGYRHMPGFGIHTYQVVNKHGQKHFVRFHFQPDLGIKNLRSEEAARLSALDPNYAIRDLYVAIGNGKFPSWTVYIQVLTYEDCKNAGFDVFDVTKILPLDRYPLRKLGRIVLNKNPRNYFAEIEQLAYCPGNLVPGIPGAPDKVFEARVLAYRDAQYYRLGGNFFKIPVNCPIRSKPLTYNRDGQPPVLDNMKDIPNYYPNSFNGPVPYKEKNRVEVIEVYQDEANNYEQARDLYVNEFSTEERSRAIENILYTLKTVPKPIQDRTVKMFTRIHPDLGNRIREGLQTNRTLTGNSIM